MVALLTALAWRLVAVADRPRLHRGARPRDRGAQSSACRCCATKLVAFAVSSFIIGVAGVLWAFAYLRTVEPDGFNLDRSFQILFIIIIGGLATIRGAFLGAALIVVCRCCCRALGAALVRRRRSIPASLDMIQRILIGALIIGFLIAEPDGLAALLQRARRRFAGRTLTCRRACVALIIIAQPDRS